MQAAVLRAVADHPSLQAACKIAGIFTMKEQLVAKYICKQSMRMMGRAPSGKIQHGKMSQEKHDAVKVVLTFSAPLPNKGLGIPSMRNHATVLGVPFSTLQFVEKYVMEKRYQLTVSKKGMHWAMVRHKKGYSKNCDKIRTLLIVALNNHPQVVVLPNIKDTLQVKNAKGEKVLVRKILTMVGI
jgi:hypothetical protein